MKIVFLGAPSTGKTSLCRALAERCGTLWMPEYGREYWEKFHDERRLSPEQLVEIAEGHIEREEALVTGANRYLFVDTDARTTYIFAKYYHGMAHPRLAKLAEQAETRYDRVFLCEDDIPYEDTWDRSGPDNRFWFQNEIIQDLQVRGTAFVRIGGTLEERVTKVMKYLESPVVGIHKKS